MSSALSHALYDLDGSRTGHTLYTIYVDRRSGHVQLDVTIITHLNGASSHQRTGYSSQKVQFVGCCTPPLYKVIFVHFAIEDPVFDYLCAGRWPR
jgi:hypothetical protein